MLYNTYDKQNKKHSYNLNKFKVIKMQNYQMSFF